VVHLGLPLKVTTPPPSKDSSSNEDPSPFNQPVASKEDGEPLHIQGIDMNEGIGEVFPNAIFGKDWQEIEPKMVLLPTIT
jgi:hypothetical protein